MPPITRAKSRLLAKQQTSETRKRPRKKPVKNDPTTKQDAGISQPPIKENNCQPVRENIVSPDRPHTITESHYPCQSCSCKKGVFHNLEDECICCSHSIMEHQDDLFDPWSPAIDYPCERQELVTSLLQMVRDVGVAVIRATPQVGKTTLLNLLGRYIVHNVANLEPVYIEWESREKRKNVPYTEYMEREKQAYIKSNAKQRPAPRTTQIPGKTRTIYLIDEAQFSYEEDKFWNQLSKNKNTRNSNLYVLVCVYGAQGISHARQAHIESQALQMHALHRIELRPTDHCALSMLFTVEETCTVIEKWAIDSRIPIEKGVEKYVHATTAGHPGMVGMLLTFTKLIYKRDLKHDPLSPTSWHLMIAGCESDFTLWLMKYGRGVWTALSDCTVKERLQWDTIREEPMYRHLSLSMIQQAMKQVAEFPGGVTRGPTPTLDALGFCHKMGYLHTERKEPTNNEITFTFASPLHRQVAYSRLFVGRVSGDSLQELCINAIARFSPATLQSRRERSLRKGWRIPEAAFQHEMYCCLNIERQNLPVLSEYAHRGNGRIDFFMSEKRWGIELLQSGTSSEIIDHLNRFSTNGTYEQWGIMENFIVINFCPRSALRKVAIDERFKPHFMNVVIEPQEFVAEIYSNDMQLLASWILGEGRERCNAINCSSVTPELGDEKNVTEAERVMRDQVKNTNRAIAVADEERKEAMKMIQAFRLEIEMLRKQLEEKNKEPECGRKRKGKGQGTAGKDMKRRKKR